MDLSDALEFSGSSTNPGTQQQNTWAGQPNNPTWPGQPGQNPMWPGAQSGQNPTWPAGPAQPTWPAGPAQPTWPAGPAQPGWPTPSSGPAVPAAAQQNLTVPFKQSLPSGVYDRMLITIAGTIKPNAEKITIDLNTPNDLAFHLNPRFNETGKKVIVRNSCISQKWGREERELQNFPFVPGQSFEMKILCTNTEFKVAVNNNHLLEFKHRISDLRTINNLNIYYDLTLSKVNIETLQ